MSVGPRESQPSVQRALLPTPRRSLGLGAPVFVVRVRSGRSCTKQQPGSENTPPHPAQRVWPQPFQLTTGQGAGLFLRRPWAQAELHLLVSWLPRDQSRRFAVQSLGVVAPWRLLCHLRCSTPPTLGPLGTRGTRHSARPRRPEGDRCSSSDLASTSPHPKHRSPAPSSAHGPGVGPTSCCQPRPVRVCVAHM